MRNLDFWRLGQQNHCRDKIIKTETQRNNKFQYINIIWKVESDMSTFILVKVLEFSIYLQLKLLFLQSGCWCSCTVMILNASQMYLHFIIFGFG